MYALPVLPSPVLLPPTRLSPTIKPMLDSVSQQSLNRVHARLAHEIGALRTIFSAGPKVLTPTIKVVTADLTEQFNFNEEESMAVLYLVTLSRIKGSENCDYFAFTNTLKRPCPKAPTGDKPFLPYLSFMCGPNKTYKVNRLDQPVNPKSHELANIMPPHPQQMERLHMGGRDSSRELASALQAAGDSVTLVQFQRIMKDVDQGFSAGDCRKLFQDALSSTNSKPTAETVSSQAILETTKPHLTMVRQKSRSSELVSRAMDWPAPDEPVGVARGSSSGRGASSSGRKPSVPAKPRGSESGASSGRQASPTTSPRGGKNTRSMQLRLAMSQSFQNDPTSPRFKGEYRCIPAVPEAHLKKQSARNITSQYSPRATQQAHSKPRTADAAEAHPEASSD